VTLSPKSSVSTRRDSIDFAQLARDIKARGLELGFQQVGITDTRLDKDETHLLSWLGDNLHGEMHYMAAHDGKRSRPQELVPGTLRIISVRMDYWPGQADPAGDVLDDPARAYVSRYALGRDYHKVLRKRLQKLADYIAEQVGPFGFRAFTDSAPVLEKAIAQKAGLGWIGKHTNLINRREGSWFFLGELFTDLPLPVDTPADNHCGSCQACIDICPTQAIVAPYRLDARRCISYLTIELRGAIPVELRKGIGNRIYGCDDCQLICPWNRFSRPSGESDFTPRNRLDSRTLIDLFTWDEAEFLRYTEGTAIRRIGHISWLRNIAVALGNSSGSEAVIEALRSRRSHPSELVQEHVLWALEQHAPRSQ
jgi:epoxyqueuosine reductase